MTKNARQRYRCLVCGYEREGEEPPVLCPVCGAGAEQFVPADHRLLRLARDIVDTFLPHAVAAHFPNGLIPVATFFVAGALVFASPSLEQAGFYVLAVAVFSLPVSFVSGLLGWKKHYKGLKVPVFQIKTRLGILLSLVGVAALAARMADPGGIMRLSGWGLAYLGLLGVMLALVVVLGHYGGKIVFFWKKGRC